MKEVMAVIRMDMINKTKEALLNEGFASINCRKVLGRGKKKVDFTLIEKMVEGNYDQAVSRTSDFITEGHRLIPKRLISMVVNDNEVESVVNVIIKVNSKGKPGDGKIFVMPILDAIRVRTGETGEQAI